MTDITVIGDVNVDLLSSPISHYPKEDSQILIPSANLQVGGGATNFAFAISRLGLKTRLIGLIGKDVFGDYIIKKTKKFKIESKLKQSEKEKTGITLGIHFKDGTKALFTFRGANAAFSNKHFRLEDLKGKAVHISGYNFCDNMRKDVERIVRYAKKKRMLVSLDPDVKTGIRFSIKEIKTVLKSVDIFFVNMKEGEVLTGKKEKIKIIKNLLNLGCKIVALKCGHRGCIIASKEEVLVIKGLEVKPIDPTGTGDVFNAAFVYDYLRTKNIRKSGIFANAAGAFAVTQFDEKRFPSYEDIKDFI